MCSRADRRGIISALAVIGSVLAVISRSDPSPSTSRSKPTVDRPVCPCYKFLPRGCVARAAGQQIPALPAPTNRLRADGTATQAKTAATSSAREGQREFRMLPRIHPASRTRSTTTAIPTNSRGSLTTLRQDRTTALVRAVGEWDLANAHLLAEQLEEHETAGRRFVRLDVSAVSFLDCTC